jgi:hypothetical protein
MENARNLLDRLEDSFFTVVVTTFVATLLLSGTRELLMRAQ